MKKIFLGFIVTIYILYISNCMSTLTAAIARESDPVAIRQSDSIGQSEGEMFSGDKKASIVNDSNGKQTVTNQAIFDGKGTSGKQVTSSSNNKETPINLNVDTTSMQLDDNVTGSPRESAVSTTSKQKGSLFSDESDGQVVDSKNESTGSTASKDGLLFSESVEPELNKNVELLDDTDTSTAIEKASDQSVVSIADQIQAPDKITANAMNEFLPEGEKMVLMGRRADGSNYMITAKTKAEATAKDSKIDTMKVLEFDERGVPIRDLSGQIKTTSLPMSKYQSQLSVPRENLLKQAQQDLANFKQPDNLQQKTDEYQKQEAAYNKAKATQDDLAEMAQSDPSVQAAYDKSKKDYQAAQQAFSMEDPQMTVQRLEDKVNQYSDKKARIATAEKKLQDAKQSSADITQKRASLEAAFKNESHAGKKAQIFKDLQAAEKTEYFADQNVKDAVSKLQYTKNSTYSTDIADFQVVFDDVTAQFINDPAVMESLRNNKDYQSYRDQVTKEIYKPTAIKGTMNGIKNLVTAMSDVGMGRADWGMTHADMGKKAFKSLSKFDLGKPFKNLGKSSRYES